MDWIDLAQDREKWQVLVNRVMNIRVPQNAWNFLTSCGTIRFSRKARLHGVIYLLTYVVRRRLVRLVGSADPAHNARRTREDRTGNTTYVVSR
jgi:hypothetical protein